ncbi:MAG: glycoside hydrolase family 43 protein, partial [Oscillospiraceae bacterium]|nr:glycoside hydrolase family 43 protein [Oscillospiraceae bacterium]
PERPDSPGEGSAAEMPLGGGCDPCFYEHEGRYYYCYSLGNGVGVKSADSLAQLWDAPGSRVYTAPEGTGWSSDYWAPELHCFDGRWYIYVCADDGANENHRMYVLSCDTPEGEYVMEGKISDPSDKWAIDGTVLQYKGELWFIWSGWESDTDGRQNLYIAHMSDPLHIDGERVMISRPFYSWEKKGMAINEAPAVLYHGENVFLFYSASGSWTDDYCIGMLTLTGEPGSAYGWAKSPLPVLTKAETAYGPGHCSFVSSGGVDYIVYHANLESGTGWNARSIRLQPLLYRFDLPVAGAPVKQGEKVIIY